MQHLSQLYDHNVVEKFFNASSAEQVLSVSDVNNFIQKLLTSIDLSVLSKVFYQQLENTLQLSALTIQFNHVDYNFGDLDNASNIKSLSYKKHDNTVATVKYGFSRVLAAGDWNILQQLHMLFGNPLKNALEHHKIQQIAMKDFLTNLGNRCSYHEVITRLLSQAKRTNRHFGLLVIDMNKFKAINDDFGHAQGDKILLTCAQTISACLRDTDFAFRVGGDEFCCLLTDSDPITNRLVVKRITRAIYQQPLLSRYDIGCSIGNASYQPGDTELSLFSRADKAMYHAKKTGYKTIICN
ncbi:MAG: diguanylate cyclase (GGDEF)-like protein [Paraglaciecola sp.]